MTKKIITITTVIIVAILSLTMMTGVAYADTSATEDDASEAKLYLAEVVYNNILTGSGSIVRSLQFYVDADKMAALTGKTVSSTTAEINLVLQTLEAYYISKGFTTSLSDTFLDITLSYYSSYTDFYIANGIDGYETSTSTNETKYSGMYVDTYITGQTIFASMGTNGLSSALEILTAVSGLETYDIEFIYNYGTKYNTNFMTSNASNIYYFENYDSYIHKFSMDIYSTDFEYELIQHSANTVLWYVIILAVGAILIGGLTTAIVLHKRSRK